MPLALLVAFIVVPLAELWVIGQVGDLIGFWWTLGLLLGLSVAGAWLVKREGRHAWRRFREALGSARMPAEEVVDGALVLFGGALLLTPGFLTDAVGLFLVLPPTRHVANRAVRRRARGAFGLGGSPPVGRPRAGDGARAEHVDVDVVRVERSDGSRRSPEGELPR
ncbi:hypothetical protein BH23ACT7_BH23ACT7_24920 [soil metagenome]